LAKNRLKIRALSEVGTRPIAKMGIALKEANESIYWVELLTATNYLDKKQSESIWNDCNELMSLLVSIIKTSKRNEANKDV